MYIVKHIVVSMVTIRTPIAFQTMLLWLLLNLQQSFMELGLNYYNIYLLVVVVTDPCSEVLEEPISYFPFDTTRTA
jgi:hypothetical protein